MNAAFRMRSGAAIALLIAIFAAGCALEPHRAEPPPEPRIVIQPAPPSEADQVLGYASRIRKLDARDQSAERELARANLQGEKSELNRLKYALLLSVNSAPPTPGDDAELITLLEPLVGVPPGSGTEAEIHVLALLLYNQALERKKLREQLRDTQARLILARRDETREAEARALRARVEELEKKLSALKSIDRSVNRRAESAAK